MPLDLDAIDAFATINFGLPWGVGRTLTPHQYNLLYRKYSDKLLIEESRFALVCATIANVNRGKGTPPYKVKDFMSRRQKQTEEEMREEFAMLGAALSKKGKA